MHDTESLKKSVKKKEKNIRWILKKILLEATTSQVVLRGRID